VAASANITGPGRSRIDRLRLSFSSIGVDALLVTHLPNIQYLCGFTGGAALLLVASAGSALYTDSRYTFQAREEVRDARIKIPKKGLLRALGQDLRGRRGKLRLGYSPTQVSVAQKKTLEGLSGGRVRWVPTDSQVEKLRAIKDPSELQTIREAAALISRVFQGVVREIRPGITELALAAELEYGMKAEGASGPSFETIVASGPRSAWAHARPSSKPLRKSELVVLDQGAILRSYCSDMTRTIFLGRASARVRRAYRAVLEAQEAAKNAIRPGIKAGAVDAAARRVLGRYGLSRYFTHSTGHGLGLEVHEFPRLGRGEKTTLEEGMVVTVEPGVYLEGVGGIRIEDDVLVSSRGAQNLTTAPREFLEL
jgi:Xaa-Pro aminopeptidase